tara:strand:+ start:3749 stop:4519 length:771 start_codon:yes stop_codon:yes gene_type:complete
LKKITIQDIKNFKTKSSPFATLTAYDFTSAQILDEVGVPLILVGDSASMTIYGYDTTIPVSMEEMLLVVKAVTRGAVSSLVVADMPFLSYQTSIEDTILNAGTFIKDGGAGAVKLEGGKHIMKHIEALVNIGIPVLGHVGLTPQSYHQLSGYSIQGKTPREAQKIIDDANAVQESGAFGVVLECIPEGLAKEITSSLTIPTIGIGSGNNCDGQIQVFHDIVGLSKKPPPKHAKQYDNLYSNILNVVKQYKADVEKS